MCASPAKGMPLDRRGVWAVQRCAALPVQLFATRECANDYLVICRATPEHSRATLYWCVLDDECVQASTVTAITRFTVHDNTDAATYVASTSEGKRMLWVLYEHESNTCMHLRGVFTTRALMQNAYSARRDTWAYPAHARHTVLLCM